MAAIFELMKRLQHLVAAAIIGTSALFYYIIDWAQTVKNYGSFLVEINLDNTAISSIADIVFLNQAGVILPEITKQLI